MDHEILARVEKQRLELEESISQLRKSLRHWQTLEIDYEGLKEEFQLLPDDTPYEECLQAARDFKPELVDDKELQSLFGDNPANRKSPSRLVDILSKRVDYVSRNVTTVRKQLSDAEKKRNALLLAQDPQHQDEAGLPLSEITEELDEDGKVVSSKVQTPGKDAPDLLEVLRKAGVPDIEEGKATAQEENKAEDGSRSRLEAEAQPEPQFKPEITASNKPAHNDDPVPPSAPLTDHLVDASDSDESESEDKALRPINPNDSVEDAALRQEMLQYGLNEVNTIVAELDLADSGNYSDDEDGDDYLSDYNEDEDLYSGESEDEKGATKNPVISERYKRQMEALSKRHGISDIKNLGPEPDLPENVKENIDRPPAAEAARQAAIARAEATKGVLKSTDTENRAVDESKAKKKKVAFAPSLDIAKETPKPQVLTLDEPAPHPVGDTVVERTAGEIDEPATPSVAAAQPSTPKKVSRFKAARSAAPPTPMFPPPMDFPSSSERKPTPEGPHGKTIASKLVERPASEISPATDPIDFDEEMHRREVAIDIQKMRNKKIHEQGGYIRGGLEDNYGEEISHGDIIDENTGKPRKVSRFKAARLKADS